MKNQEKSKKIFGLNLLKRNSKDINSQELQKRIDELENELETIWKEVGEQHIKKEIGKTENEVDEQLSNIEGNLRGNIKLFLEWWEDDYRKEKEKEELNSHPELVKRTSQFKDGLINNQGVDETWLEELCKKKEEIIKLEDNISQGRNINEKIKLLREILDSNSEASKENAELKKRVLELKTEISKLQEQLQNKERIIIEKVTKYLETKRSYIEVRLTFAKKMQECCDNLERKNIESEKRGKIIKGISDILGILTCSFKTMDIGFSINLSKLAEVVSDANDYQAIISRVENGEEFKKYLENKDSLPSFKKVYDSLKKTLKEYEELGISKKIISNDSLDLELDGGTLKDFEVKYEKICSIAENWERKHSDLNKMQDKVNSIIKTLDDLNKELNIEKNKFKGIKEQHQSQIQIPPK